MSELLTYRERFLASSVRVGGLWAPPGAVSKVLLNYCDPLVLYNDDQPEYSISRRGSCTKVKHNGRYFVFCADHQLVDYEPESAALINKSNGNAVTSHSCRFSRRDQFGGATFDVLRFEFTEAIQSSDLEKTGWFDTTHVMQSGEAVELAVAIGFPHLDRQIDYENTEIPVAPRAIFGSYMGNTFGDLQGLNVEPEIEYDPDGISGGPVFGLNYDERDLCFDARLIGMTTNASRAQINFAGLGILESFLPT